MIHDRSGPVLQPMGLLFGCGTVAGMTDGELLERFTTRRGPEGEAAFAAVVRRHGPMVLGVCRQYSGDAHDADDAFQATFVTLARKAGALRQPDRLGPWLHGVAVRKARKLKQQRQRRFRHESRGAVGHVDEASTSVCSGHCEESAALHEELRRLPEKYRAPIVLCYLQGHTHETAAAVLGWPLGTVRGRLARAREQLRARLAARGVAPAGMVVGGGPWLELVRAIVPPALVDAAVGGAMEAVGGEAALIARLTTLKGMWPDAMSAGAMRIATLLVLACGVAAGGFASARRPSIAPRAAAVTERPGGTVDQPAASHAPREQDLPVDQLPPWVRDAVRNLQPESAIVRATRESETVYLVEISDGRKERSLRVSGQFASGRKRIDVRRIPDGSFAGPRV